MLFNKKKLENFLSFEKTWSVGLLMILIDPSSFEIYWKFLSILKYEYDKACNPL